MGHVHSCLHRSASTCRHEEDCNSVPASQDAKGSHQVACDFAPACVQHKPQEAAQDETDYDISQETVLGLAEQARCKLDPERKRWSKQFKVEEYGSRSPRNYIIKVLSWNIFYCFQLDKRHNV